MRIRKNGSCLAREIDEENRKQKAFKEAIKRRKEEQNSKK